MRASARSASRSGSARRWPHGSQDNGPASPQAGPCDPQRKPRRGAHSRHRYQNGRAYYADEFATNRRSNVSHQIRGSEREPISCKRSASGFGGTDRRRDGVPCRGRFLCHAGQLSAQATSVERRQVRRSNRDVSMAWLPVQCVHWRRIAWSCGGSAQDVSRDGGRRNRASCTGVTPETTRFYSTGLISGAAPSLRRKPPVSRTAWITPAAHQMVPITLAVLERCPNT